jgi:homocysteine S-methyltransferase
VVIYPNSGERWDALQKSWIGPTIFRAEDVKDWIIGGARLVGGCCRVGPTQINKIRDLMA